MPTTTPFNNLITFSRGSNATVTGSNGLIQWAPNNLLTFSEQFDNTAWFKGNTTVTANAAVAPDGSTTADQIAFAAVANANIQPNPAVTVTAGLTYTFSVYVRASAAVSNVNLSLQGSDTLVSIGTDWTRVSMTVTASGGTLSPTLVTRNSVASTIFAWGAQLELGSTATTYNPTTVKNLLGFSEAFDNAAWSKTRTSIVTGAQANPINGLFNAQKLMEDTTASATHPVSVGFTFAAIPYTMSVYAKAAGRNWIYLAMLGTTNSFASFNLSNGTVGTVGAAATAAIQDVGNGWYRCRITSTATAGAGTAAFYPASADNTISYTGDGNSGVYIYGAQLSDSASLDPYVPTPGAAPSSTAFYGPRFDFDPVTLQPRGLLVEEQRTNLLVRSDDFTTTWAASGATITANATASPDGTANADALVEDGTTGLHLTQQFFTFLNATAYTVSVYVKASTRTWVQVLLPAAAFTASQGGFFNLSGAGSLGTVTGTPTSRSITAVGNGWYRITITATSTAAAGGNIAVVAASADGTTSYAGTNGATALFPWGAQLEAGVFATSYIPTVASTVTRSADVATITGQNFAQWYRQDAGSFAVDFSALVSANTNNANVLSSYASGTNLNRIWMWSGAPGVVRNSVVSGGTGVAELTGTTVVANALLKAAAAYQVDSYGFSTNGGAVASDTSGALPSGISLLGIGQTGASTEYLNGHIRSIRFIPARAADFQLQALST